MEAQSNLFQLKAEKFNNPNIWAVIHGDDPFNDVIRNATQDYLNGQQTNAITNLTNQTLNDARQAQQGGSDSGGDTQQGGSGGGSSTSQGVSAFNGGQNFPERLNYSRQAMAEQAETNFQGLLDYFNTDPIMQSILKDGKDSPYLSEVSPEIAEQIANIFKESYDIANNLQRLQNKEDYQNAYINLIGKLNESVSHLSDLLSALTVAGVKVLNDAASAVFNRVATLFTIMDVGAKETELSKMKLDFYNKYGVNIDEGIEIEYKKNLIAGTTRLTYPNYKIRDVDPVKYDEYIFKKIELDQLKSSALKGMVMLIVDAHAPAVVAALKVGGATAAAGAVAPILGVIGIIISADSHAQQATAKANYLSAAHVYEQSWELTYFEQLFGMKYGTVKGWFKGNETPSSSRSVVEPSSNTSLKRLKASGLLLNAVATTPTLVFNGSAGNDTLFNIEDNYLISAGEGDDQISNVGDRVTINAGTGNDYIANLGDNVSINGGVGNNVIDNSGANVIMNFADGDNYVGNGGDYVTVTAGDGNNYVDNVGNFTNIQLGNGANDVENFGSNVTVNTGSGVDFIVNYGVNTTVNAGSGKNVIFNSYGSNVLINTDKDDDYISVKEGSDRVTINAGNGSDTVINNGTNDLINLEAGNDFIYNDSRGSSATISGLDGDDSLENRAAFVSINGGEGSNNFVNDGFAVTMIGGSGADTIANAGNEALINSGDGNNSIGNAGDTVSIFVGDGTDSILNEGYKVTINVAGGSNQVTNKGSETSIIVGSGSNTVQNYGEATNIKGGVDSDFIMNGATETTIDGGSGADTVLNYLAVKVGDDGNATDFYYNSNNVSIQGGLGDDYIENMGAFGTIAGDTGNDTIKNFGVLLIDQNSDIIRTAPVSNYYYQIDAGEGDNFIYNENARATITSGKGYDLIENIADTVSINAGDGINTIANVGNTVTIQSGSGDDSIESDGSFVSISAGEGDDFIRNYSNGSNTTIEAGKGDDTIILEADVQNSVINYNLGDGTDIIYGCNSTTTIKIHGSSFNTNQSGNDMIVKVGDNKLILNGATSVSGLTVVREDTPEPEIISGTKGADTINNSLSDAMIFGLGGADSITNSAADVLIDGGSAGDYIYSNGKNVTIKGGTGADIIHNRGWQSNALIDGGTGGDKIYNDGYDSTIDGGDDSDYITNWADGSTLCGGEGNDTIVNLGYCQDNLLIGGTGNDFIGNGVDGKLSYGTVYNTTIDAGEGDDTIQNNGANVSINAGTGSDDIANYYRNVTINAGADNDHITNIGAVVSIDAGSDNDYISNSGSSVTIKGGKGNDTLDAVGSEIILFGTGDGSDVINNWQNKNLISLTSGKIFNTLLSGEDIIISLGYDSLTLKNAKCKLVQIDNVDGTKTIINEERLGQTISNDLSNQTLVSGLGNDSIYNTGNNVTIQSSEGDDSITNRGANVLIEGNADSDNIENNKFIEWNYNDQWSTSSISPDNVTILGGAADDTIFNYGGQRISINASAGDDYIENKSEPYVYKPERPPSLENEDDYEEIIYPTPDRATLLGAGGNDTIINSGQHSVIDGGSGNDYISNSGSSVTIKGGKGSDFISNFGNNSTILGGTGNDTILNEGNNALFIYSGGNDLINGFNETSTLQIDNGKDTYSKEIIGADVLISVGSNVMTLKGAARLSNINILGNEKFSWSLNDTVANYGNLFTISNVKNTDSISVDNKKKIITLKAENLTGKNVSLTSDFTLKLAGDVPISTTKTPGSFTKFANGTAAFKTTSSSDYYSLKDNKITYTAPSGGKTVSIKNLNSSATLDKVKAGITVAEQKNSSLKITFKNSDVLTTKAPAISAKDVSYTVAVAKSLKPAALAPDWQVSGTNASLKSDTSAGYIVSDNKILYSKKITGSPQLVLGGLVKNSSLSAPVKKVVTLDSKVLGKNTSLKSNDGSYTVKLTGNMSKKTFTGSANADSLNIAANNATVLGGAGNDSFTVSSSKVTLTGGKGNDSFKLSGKNPMLIYNTGDGNDTVNFVTGMQISLSGDTQIKTLGKSGSDLLLGFGKNSSIKVTGAKSTDTLKVSDASGSVTLVAGKFDLADSLTFNSKNSSVKVAKNFSGSLAPSDDIYLGGSKLSSVATINASNVTSKITISGNDKANTISAGKNNDIISGGNGNDSIVGNAGNDKLYGQNGNDSLWGGKGNDSLWGGDGKDVFIYSAGKDIIADFTAGQDKIKIASGKISKSSLSGSDVIFTIGKGSLTVKNAKGKTISLIDSTGKASSTVVGAQTLTNSNKANVTIATDTGVVDASKRTKAIQITGNALANSISGGSKNDSIYGGAGNDSIVGNAGNDKLYGQDGNDILKGGKGNDSLWGGKGNDSLWGDAGNDTFIYTANKGTDKIFDYSTGDILKILNVDGSNGSFKSSKFSGADLTLTINSGGKIIFEDVSASTKFNINGSSYIISGSKLFKK